MTKLIIFLVKKFKGFDDYFAKIVLAYVAIKKKEQAEIIDIKKLAEQRAQEDLKRIVAYEKMGEASGYQKPIIARPGRK